MLGSVDTSADLNNSPRTSFPQPTSAPLPLGGGATNSDVSDPGDEPAEQSTSLTSREETRVSTQLASASGSEQGLALTAATGGGSAPQTATEARAHLTMLL